MDMQVAAKDVSPIIPYLAESLDAATQFAQQFFATNQKPVNLSLAADIVRWFTRDYMRDKFTFVDDCEAEDIANNGLSIRFGRYHLRIWKTNAGEVPTPGQSKRKDQFMRQERSVQMRFAFADRIQHNLAILWSVDKEYGLEQLYLACPKKDDICHRDWEWIMPLDPAETIITATTLYQEYDPDLPFEPLHDIDDKAKEDSPS